MKKITYTCNVVSTMLGQDSRNIVLSRRCSPNTSEKPLHKILIGPERADILWQENRFQFEICLVVCFLAQYHKTILAFFVQCCLASSYTTCGTAINRGRRFFVNIYTNENPCQWLFLFLMDVESGQKHFKSCSKYYKVLKVCLTILRRHRVLGLAQKGSLFLILNKFHTFFSVFIVDDEHVFADVELTFQPVMKC